MLERENAFQLNYMQWFVDMVYIFSNVSPFKYTFKT
jgi:hypothetical protein